MQKKIINFEYNKLNLKEIIVLIPKNHSNLNSFLTPILGLYGINLKDFINEFAEQTKFINNFDIILPIKVLITKIKTFSMRLVSPYISSLLNLNTNFIKNILNFYKIFLIKFVSCKILFKSSIILKKLYKNIRVYLNKTYKTNNLCYFKRPVLSFDNFFFFKRPEILFLRKLIYLKYGVIFFFFNHASYKISDWQKDLIFFNLKVLRIYKNLNIFLNFYKKDTYFLGSNCLNNLFNFFKLNFFKEVSTFKLLLWKFNMNFLSNVFFMENFYQHFNKTDKNFLMKNILKLFLILINNINFVLNTRIYIFTKTFKIFYLDNNYANL